MTLLCYAYHSGTPIHYSLAKMAGVFAVVNQPNAWAKLEDTIRIPSYCMNRKALTSMELLEIIKNFPETDEPQIILRSPFSDPIIEGDKVLAAPDSLFFFHFTPLSRFRPEFFVEMQANSAKAAEEAETVVDTLTQTLQENPAILLEQLDKLI